MTTEMHAALLQGLMSVADDNVNQTEAQGILQFAWLYANQTNVNALANHLSQMLTRELTDAYVYLPSHYVGIFPTGTFNAHCDIHKDARLILLAAGAFEMVEAGVILSLCLKPDPEYACAALYEHMKAYVVARAVPSPLKLGKGLVKWSSKVPAFLMNAGEHILIAHELGHLVLGHLQTRATMLQGTAR
jgi:hypothetical protein